MELLAVALGGCTAMDVVSILMKMRQPLEGFASRSRGERAEEHPKRFTRSRSSTTSRATWTSARCSAPSSCRRSEYCSVEATLRPAVPHHLAVRHRALIGLTAAPRPAVSHYTHRVYR